MYKGRQYKYKNTYMYIVYCTLYNVQCTCLELCGYSSVTKHICLCSYIYYVM